VQTAMAKTNCSFAYTSLQSGSNGTDQRELA
jgi:hypothetical protein